MAASLDITTVHKGEPVNIDFYAKNGSGGVIANAASQTVHITFSTTPGGEPVEQFSTADSQITLADAGTGLFEIRMSASDLASLAEGTTYHLNIWTEIGGVKRLQIKGTIKLLSSIEP